MLGSEVTRKRPSASITIVFFIFLASAISARTEAIIAGSLPNPGPITRLCNRGNQGRIAVVLSATSPELETNNIILQIQLKESDAYRIKKKVKYSGNTEQYY